MEYCTRDGYIVSANNKQDKIASRLYGTAAGRILVSLLIRPGISKVGGKLLSSRSSRLLIRPYVKKSGIDMSQYEHMRYRSYNDFFTRRVLPGMRPVDNDPSHLISPCDGKLTVLPITADGILRIKDTDYTVISLLRDRPLAEKYLGGTAFIFRLTVDDYHRYMFMDSGELKGGRFIKGVYHTVHPAAGERYPVYKENSRDYSIFESDNFGPVIVMEVGALLVGRIVNRPVGHPVERGVEKGHFEYGGSTIVLLFEKDRIVPDRDILYNSAAGLETIVKAGEKIGCKFTGDQNHGAD